MQQVVPIIINLLVKKVNIREYQIHHMFCFDEIVITDLPRLITLLSDDYKFARTSCGQIRGKHFSSNHFIPTNFTSR